jgi:hypothetical protein
MGSPPPPPSTDHQHEANDLGSGLVVRFHTSRTEPDVDGLFLTAGEASTLGPAAARWVTDFHCTGNSTSVHELVTEKGVQLDVALHPSRYVLSSDGLTVRINDRTRLNITASRKAVAINGTVGTTMSGQASVGLDDCFASRENGVSTLVQLSYANWSDMSSVVQISHPTVVDLRAGGVGSEIANVVFSVDEELDDACKDAEQILEAIYNAGVQTREIVVFEPAPPLSKTVMRVPFGINGSTYDVACNAVDRPPSLNRTAFESLARAALTKEMNMDQARVDAVVQQCSSPCIAATMWAPTVANSMSTIVNLCCPYRVDGVSTIMPTGLSLVAAESWKAEAAREGPKTVDDCDGSMAFVTSQLVDATAIARSPELSRMYPVSAAFSNAMAHHCVGACVLSANAGHAESAGDGEPDAVAGHAIALAIDKPTVLRALVTGLAATLQEKPDDVIASARVDLGQLWSKGLYASEDVLRMPVEERAVVTGSYERIMNLPSLNAGFVPLSMEGTSPVSPSTLYPKDDLDTLRRRKLGHLDKKVEQMIGPTVTRAVSQLDVADEGDKHVFYNDFVEFLLPLRDNPMFTDASIRDRGFATAQFVFTQPTDPRRAGATPKQTAEGSFGLLPLWKLNAQQASSLDIAIEEVRQNTMPYRNTPNGHVLSPQEAAILEKNVSRLKAITNGSSVSTLNTHDVQHLVSFAALTANEHAINAFAQRISELPTIDVLVDVIDAPGVLATPDGGDVGKVVVVNLKAGL